MGYKNFGNYNLPAVTSEDAGKGIVVNDSGDYSLGEGGAGGGNFLYLEVEDIASGEEVSGVRITTTFSDILQGLNAGKTVMFEALQNDLTEIYWQPIFAEAVIKENENKRIVVAIVDTSSSQLNITTFQEHPDYGDYPVFLYD